MNHFICEGEEDDEFPVDVRFFNIPTGSSPVTNVVCLENETEMEVDSLEVEEDPLADVHSIDEKEDEVVIVTESVPKAPVPVAISSVPKGNFKNLSLVEFEVEMDQSVKEIVAESLALFDKDPREYHPFYLRIFKYILIGKNLGYVDNSGEWSEHQIWNKFDQFAKSELALKRKGIQLTLLGEQSAYATYILTKKVVINGQIVHCDKKWNDKERVKMYRGLEGLVNRIRREWNGDDDGGIREDLKTRLQFFKECQKITHPTEVVKMNNLWKKLLLDEDGLVKKKVNSQEKPVKSCQEKGPRQKIVVKVLVKSPPPSPQSHMSPPSPEPTEPVHLLTKEEDVIVSDDKLNKLPQIIGNNKLIKSKPSCFKKKALNLRRKQKAIKPNGLTLKRKLKLLKQSVNKPITKTSTPAMTMTPLQAKLEKIIAKRLTLPGKKTTASKPEVKKKSSPKSVESKASSSSMSTQLPQAVQDYFKLDKDKETGDFSCICDECGEFIPHRNYLSTHKIRKHNPESNRKFHCPHCPKLEIINVRDLWNHFAREHMDLEQLCPEIGQVNAIQVERKVTPRLPRPPRPVQNPSIIPANEPGSGGTCEHCGKYLECKNTLLRHLKTMHGMVNFKNCQYCQKEFKSKCARDAHIKRFHLGTEIIKCSICNKSCATSGKLWKHRVEEHGLSAEEEAASLGVQYETCQFCGELVQKGKALRVHVERGHPENFGDWWKLEVVRRREHKLSQKRVKGKKYKYVRTKKNRVEAEGGSKAKPEVKERKEVTKKKWVNRGNNLKPEVTLNWHCPKEDCDQSFGTKKNLLVHMWHVHCNFEVRLFKEKLVRFVRKSGIHREYLCTLCKSRVYDRGHVRVHFVHCHPDIYQCCVDNSPFPNRELKCADCSSGRFAEEEELREHVESCHGELCWRCPECSKVMLSSEEMAEHFEVDHKTKEEKPRYRPWMGTMGTLSAEERLRIQQRRKEVYSKYQGMRCECEICGSRHTFGHLPSHLLTWHELKEDGDLWKCPVCERNKFSNRRNWLAHMELYHEGEVDMQEMVEVAKKINTKEDWRQMGVKTIKRCGNRHKIYQKVSVGPVDKKKAVAQEKNKRKESGVIKRRRGRRRKVEEVKLEEELEEKKVTKETSRKMIRTKSGRQVNQKKLWEPEITTENKRRKPRACVLKNNLEKKKRLIILVERLGKEEILKWTSNE